MNDPGIEEVRQARYEISRECGHDLHKVASYYREVERELRQSGKFQFEDPPSTGHAATREPIEGGRKVTT